MKLPKIQDLELKTIHSEAGVLQLVARVKAHSNRHKRKNPLQSQNHVHPEVAAFRKKVAHKGRYLAQAYLKNITTQVISPKELRSSQDDISVATLRRFL